MPVQPPGLGGTGVGFTDGAAGTERTLPWAGLLPCGWNGISARSYLPTLGLLARASGLGSVRPSLAVCVPLEFSEASLLGRALCIVNFQE